MCHTMIKGGRLTANNFLFEKKLTFILKKIISFAALIFIKQKP